MLVPPNVVPHHEDPYGRLVQDTVVYSLEPIVEPAEVDPVQVGGHGVGGEAEVMVSDHTASPRPMLPRADEQLLSAPGVIAPAVGPHTQEVANCTSQKDVVPPAYVAGRDT